MDEIINKNKIVRSGLWSFIDGFSRQGMQFFITLILARLLTPEDYGTIALLSIFIGIATVLSESNFSIALIQRKNVTEVDISTVFFFNVLMALGLSAVLCFFSSNISSFYNKPVLKPLLYMLCLNLVLNSLGSVHRTILIKNLEIGKQTILSIVSAAISGGLAIFLAYKDFGVWCLAYQLLIASLISTPVLWIITSWRPRFVFSIKSIRSLFGFSSYLLLSDLLENVFNRLGTLLIGKLYSPTDLGYYSRANGTQLLPASLLSKVLNRVAFPVFSRAADDREFLRLGTKRSIETVMMLNLPIMLGMIVTAQPLVVVLFGVQWLQSVIYLKILCLNGIFWPLQIINHSVLQAQGFSKLSFRLELLKKILGIIIIIAMCSYSIEAIAWGMVVSGGLGFLISATFTGRFLKYGAAEQMLDVLPYLCASIVMAVVCSLVPYAGSLSMAIQLPLQIITGVLVYCFLCWIFKFRAFLENFEILKTVVFSSLSR